jgi:hypothetical protein
VPLPRGVLVDGLRDLTGQLTPTGATLPSGGSTVDLLCPVIEHEPLGMGMKVKGLKLCQPSFNLHYAHILHTLTAVGADQVFSLHAAHLLDLLVLNLLIIGVYIGFEIARSRSRPT